MAPPPPMFTSLLEANINTHLPSQHIVPLDFDSLSNVPESHVWTNETLTDFCSSSESKQYSVPILDLTDVDIVSLVKCACRDWGVFQVTNHGVPPSLIDDVAANTRRLFGLPAEQKHKVLRSSNGITGYGAARISSFFSKLMWHEGFTIMGSAVDHAKQLWPLEYEEFCNSMDIYQKKMTSLAHRIMAIMLKALGANEEDQEKIFTNCLFSSQGALQLNSYPSCPNPKRAIGLGPHTDSLLLTILHQNDTNGLQIFRESVGWITVEPVSGALVVNIGDLMHIMSNGLFRAVCHRVVPSQTRHRFTFAYFYGPPADSVVEPLARVLGVGCFRPVMVKEYIRLKYEHFEKALDFIRV